MFKVIFVVLIFLISTGCSKLKKEDSLSKSYSVKPIDFTQPLKCYLDIFQEISGNKDALKNGINEVEVFYPTQQSKGLIQLNFTFTNDGTNKVLIKPDDFNGDRDLGYGYILHVDKYKVVVIEQAPLVELTAFYPIFVHTFFKETGMYIYYKTNTIVNMGDLTSPRGTMASGWCE